MTQFKDATGFSKLDCFRACPRKFKYQFIDKLPQGEPGPALVHGSTIHDGLEAYLRGWQADPPAEAEKWRESLDALRKQPTMEPEQNLGFDKNWKKLPDWFHKDTWLRVKMDAYYFDAEELVVIDFKTGKYRVPSTDQVELYACAGIELAPHVKQVRAEFWFIDTEETYSKVYTIPEIHAARKKFELATAPMYNETQWKPTPSRECRWCPYSKSKGGPCDF